MAQRLDNSQLHILLMLQEVHERRTQPAICLRLLRILYLRRHHLSLTWDRMDYLYVDQILHSAVLHLSLRQDYYSITYKNLCKTCPEDHWMAFSKNHTLVDKEEHDDIHQEVLIMIHREEKMLEWQEHQTSRVGISATGSPHAPNLSSPSGR